LCIAVPLAAASSFIFSAASSPIRAAHAANDAFFSSACVADNIVVTLGSFSLPVS